MNDRAETAGVLVTGSTSGIGEAIAARFVAEGANVVVTGRDRRRGNDIARRLSSAGTGRVTFIPGDLATIEGPLALAEAAEAWLGSVDVLVNNAAVYKVEDIPLEAEAVDEMFHVNVRGAHLLSTALIPGMARRGHGVVINVTSPAAYRGYPALAAYSATKAALDMLTKCWAAEYGPAGVRVVSLSPGPVVTPGVKTVVGTDIPISEVVVARTGVVAGRVATGGDIASAVFFLTQPEAAYVQGATLHVDGGMDGVGSLWEAPFEGQ